MKKEMLLLIIVVMSLGVFSSGAFALTRMGPPMAGLKDGQFAFGLELSKGEMDVEMSGFGIRESLDDLESLNCFAKSRLRIRR